MKKTLLILIAICTSLTTLSQTSTYKRNINIPQEKVYVHHNTTLFLTGEYIYYKVYCLNNKTQNLSNFSKIAYVELVSSNKNIVFKHKIILNKGTGQGDYFIPTSIPSGNYKIIGYTQWMKNGKLSDFYQNDISIINPFQNDQKAILSSNKDNKNELRNQSNLPSNNFINSKLIDLQVNSQYFKTRDKVTLSINNLTKDFYGNYSLSVRKIDSIQIPNRSSTINFFSKNLEKNNSVDLKKTPNVYLPELRGELLSGKVINKSSKAPVQNIKVALSIPGENYIFKVSNTNKLGVFYFNLDKEYENKNAIIQIIDDNKDQFDFSLDQHQTIDYSSLIFNRFTITPEIKDLILQNSINNQIENAYANVKTDSLKNIADIPLFYNKPSREYLLSDYTRFPTIKETILEVIEEAYVRQKKNEYTIHVRVYDEEVESGLQSLLLIDGAFIQNHNDIVTSKANKIKKISVVNEQYVYGSQIFEGIISMETFEGNYKNLLTKDYSKNIELFKPLAQKDYFKQIYGDIDKLNRIPDKRNQLLWEPNLVLKNKQTTYSFYTSDLKGDFEISLEGINQNGKPISIRKTITVN